MNAGFDLDQYLSDGVETIVSDALKASLKNPKETAFLLQYALCAKRAEAARNSHAKAGRHVPSFLIASITSRCNLHCAGCYARANNICHDGADDNLLSDEQWDSIFVQAKEIGVSFVLLAGGEPMLRRGVIERASSPPKSCSPSSPTARCLANRRSIFSTPPQPRAHHQRGRR